MNDYFFCNFISLKHFLKTTIISILTCLETKRFSKYEKYHDQGLEILGVSLDGRRGQQKPKEAWLKAIKDDKLTWHQVSKQCFRKRLGT